MVKCSVEEAAEEDGGRFEEGEGGEGGSEGGGGGAEGRLGSSEGGCTSRTGTTESLHASGRRGGNNISNGL